MSTAIVDCEAVQNTLPACLHHTKENQHRPVTLLDMLRFYAQKFVATFSTLGQAMMEIRSGRSMPSDRTLRAIDGSLEMLQEHCEQMGLEFSAVHLKRLRKSDALRSLPEMLKALEELQQRVWDELDARVYIQIPYTKSKYYEPTDPPFGQKVFDQFHTAIDDILEAGTCLALERNTAAVFHLMRVMESALRVLATELGIPYAPSWESYLRRLTEVVEGDWKSKSSDLIRKQPLYKDVLGDIQRIKIAWRNPTMHIDKSYSPEEATQIYDCVKHLMMRLADAGLSE